MATLGAYSIKESSTVPTSLGLDQLLAQYNTTISKAEIGKVNSALFSASKTTKFQFNTLASGTDSANAGAGSKLIFEYGTGLNTLSFTNSGSSAVVVLGPTDPVAFVDNSAKGDIIISSDVTQSVSIGSGTHGNFYVVAGAGKESLYGGAGKDTLLGGGDTWVQGGDSLKQTLDGGFTSLSHDTLQGGAAVSVLKVLHGDNSLAAGSGNATLTAGDGKDTLTGGAGNDSLVAGLTSTVTGGSGNDTITGGAKAGAADWITGGTGTGTDKISVKFGDNTIVAGSNSETITSGDKGTGSGNGGDQISLTGGGTDLVKIGGGSATDTVTYNGVGADTIVTSGHVDIDVTATLEGITSVNGVTTLQFADGSLEYHGTGQVTIHFSA
jgi:Ca2+-binding RTX toxin-like protein